MHANGVLLQIKGGDTCSLIKLSYNIKKVTDKKL